MTKMPRTERICTLKRKSPIPARLVVVAAVFGFPVGTALLIFLLYDGLPSGSYPIWFFALPVLVGMFFLVLLGFRFLKLLGIAVYISEKDNKPDQPRSTGSVEQRENREEGMQK